MKKTLLFALLYFIIFTFTGCKNDYKLPESSANESSAVIVSEDTCITIPDIFDIDEATAKNILSSNLLIPSVKYEYDDTIEQGNVIKAHPNIGEKVNKNSKVTLYISKGPSYLQSRDSRAEWRYLSSNKDEWQDEWNFYNPYIQNGVLYINCFKVTFGCDMEWQDRYHDGELIGVGSITDTFDKTVPVSAKYKKQVWKANESQGFTLEIPLTDLDISHPTDMYLRLYTNNDQDVRVNFYITW